MDTSETYIKMCDCPEMQELWDKSDLDCLVSYGDDRAIDDWRWLPRQGQLQEMVKGEISFDPVCLIEEIDSWLCTVYWNGHAMLQDTPFTSMEQLWLAFVMHEKFWKIWTGESWETKHTKKCFK